ncbi:MAG: acetolactate synthase, large subunit, biosynthetic type [Chloroflexi bacterium HGW-Chloroflexi-1]|nr:MAG: acetolactate synthase, large subunit, biosynthetic type [Chloroflexi bacterium HGW-Chloroflexi-1]
MKRTGAQIVWESMLREGVEVAFGYPGGAIMPVYDALLDYPVHHVLVRHEENAAFAADGYARASGKVGVCVATSGPGATNLVTGLADAMMDSVPVVAITGQVASNLVGSDAFQETDVTGVTLPVTKHNYLVTRVEGLAGVLKEAFHIARSGRPGPVLIDVCKDVQVASTDFDYDAIQVRLPGYRPVTRGTEDQIEAAATLINAAQRPIILAGHGIILSGAYDELQALAEKGHILVSTTLLGIGTIPESHPLNLRMMGMHGEAYVNQAVQAADLIIALGMRFDDRVTGTLRTYAQNAQVIHVDIDPAEIGKNVVADIGIIGDAKNVLAQILPRVEYQERAGWFAQIEEWCQDSTRRDILNQESDNTLHVPFVIDQIRHSIDGNGQVTIVSDVGQHQMWAAQYFRHERRNRFFTSGGLGSMGCGLPMAVGAAFARPDEEVWVIAGDGGFQMSLPELATVAQERLPIKIAVMRNGYLGMVRQWQELLHDKRYSGVAISSPDFVKVAEAYGILGMRADQKSQVAEVIAEARAHPGPTLIDFVVEQEVNVYPMVGPGKALHEMLRRPAA